MKIGCYYAGAFFFVAVVVAALLGKARSPEALLLGNWKELAWEYEKDKTTPVMHRGERWKFLPGQQLLLLRKDGSEKAHWHLAGRANVLLLRYGSGITELYNVTEFTPDRLVLNFATDIQARGVAKLTFARMASVP